MVQLQPWNNEIELVFFRQESVIIFHLDDPSLKDLILVEFSLLQTQIIHNRELWLLLFRGIGILIISCVNELRPMFCQVIDHHWLVKTVDADVLEWAFDVA